MKVNEPNTKEIELQQEITADERALDEARARAITFESNAKAELANLEFELPGVLLACIQRHGLEEPKREIRNRISD